MQKLTPEQIARERGAFESDFDPAYGIAWEAWLARAEIAAAEREQIAPYVQHKPSCPKGTLLPQLEYVCRCTCGLDAILAPRETEVRDEKAE